MALNLCHYLPTLAINFSFWIACLVFATFKNSYNIAAANFIAFHSGKTIDISTIPYLVGVAFTQAFTPMNIVCGFRSSGIWPFNLNVLSFTNFLSSYVSDQLSFHQRFHRHHLHSKKDLLSPCPTKIMFI